MEKLWIRGGTVCDNKGVRKADVLVIHDKIQAVRNYQPQAVIPPDYGVIDAEGLYVLPGLIDAHVHFYMRSGEGRTADDFVSGGRGALAGGITTVIDFARPLPGKPLADGLRARIAEVQKEVGVDYTFHMGLQGWYVRQGLVEEENLLSLRRAGISSVKLFTTYGDSMVGREELEFLFPLLKKAGLLPMVHAELDGLCAQAREKAYEAGRTGPDAHALMRPPQAEVEAIRLLIALGQTYGVPVYIAHVSTADGAELIRRARKVGLPVMGETCAHYLLKTEACYSREDAAFTIASPPLRREEDCQALWEALGDGTLQCVVSDHCAFSKEQKLKTPRCAEIPAGISGVETTLPLLYTCGVETGRLSLPRMVQLMAENPARIFGLASRKGSLQPGNDADITLFDPRCRGILRADELRSKSEYTVFDGVSVSGAVAAVLLRGNIVFEHADAVPVKTGEFIVQKGSQFV